MSINNEEISAELARNEFDESFTDTNSLVEDELDPNVSPVAEEGTPVDPAAPPTDIVNGTDLLNGYDGEDDDL
jgi:hypothetical protein